MERQETLLPDEHEHDLLESRMMRKHQVRFGGGPMEKDWQRLVPRQRPTLRPRCHRLVPPLPYVELFRNPSVTGVVSVNVICISVL
jgi:hypothetical protein